MGTNWANLYAQNRCKSIGIPWTDEEANAVYNLKIPADFVRQGCFTEEDYQKKKNKIETETTRTGKVFLVHLKKNQLVALCEKHGIQITPDAPRLALLDVLMSKGLPKSIPITDIPEGKNDS